MVGSGGGGVWFVVCGVEEGSKRKRKKEVGCKVG